MCGVIVMDTFSANKVILMPWLQSIIEKGQMSDSVFFQFTDLLDWRKRGNNQAVLEPLITFLAESGDEAIFAFDDKMAELLYALDTRKVADLMIGNGNVVLSADEFLYARCVALVNGESTYRAVLNGTEKLRADIEFRPILYVPSRAWARRHNENRRKYPHKYCYEVFDSIGR